MIPHCARPTRPFLGRALREHRGIISYLRPPCSRNNLTATFCPLILVRLSVSMISRANTSGISTNENRSITSTSRRNEGQVLQSYTTPR